ncbi:uncharacterized protein LOC129808954 [Phlebotomus papatasi]|uniref:uncharacterized protein LOC129808954 n=2 Tax=Phlebotomus papatasi TaxID=29031 RepID=UPI00248450AD|nr:uncharacterized protein LOC129808954 [Phlebotomus papatasi]
MPLRDKRATLKGHLTRIENYIQSIHQGESVASVADINTHLTKLKDTVTQLRVVHDELIKSGIDLETENEEHERILARTESLEGDLTYLLYQQKREEEKGSKGDFEEEGKNMHSNKEVRESDPNFQSKSSSLEEALALLIRHQTQAETRNQELFIKLQETILTHSHDSRGSKLPVQTVPDFFGEYTEWRSFRDMFTNIVDKDPRLSGVQKMQYLMTSVKGNAKKLIGDLSLSDANYKVAWESLCSHYEDQFSVVRQHIQTFIKIPKMSNPTADTFTDLFATANSVLNSLDALKVTSRDPWVICLLLDRLDHETKVLWSREIKNQIPSTQQFMSFLKDRMKSIQMCEPVPTKSDMKGNSNPINSKNHNVLAATAQFPCTTCGASDHKIFKCPKFFEMTPQNRLDFIRKNKLCRKCLTQNHSTKDCSFFPCRKCAGHHSTLLHEAFQSQPNEHSQGSAVVHTQRDAAASTVAVSTVQVEDDSTPPLTSTSDLTAVVSSSTSSRGPKRIFLETAVVRVLDKYGVPHQCRALLDSGAQVNLISQALVQRLKLPKSHSDVFIGRVVDGGTKAKFQTECNIQSANDFSINFFMTCLIVPSVLAQRLPNWEVTAEEIPLPSGIQLADPTWHISQPVDILISNEFYNEIFTGKFLRLGTGLPMVKESLLGWVVSGKQDSILEPVVAACVATTLSSIESSLKRFWEVEEVSIFKPGLPDHKIVEDIFQRTTVRNSEGRYVVHVPFRPNVVRLHNNLPNATRQFLSLERRLALNPELQSQYHSAMKENFDLGFFEEVPPSHIQNASYYMPHHCVAKSNTSGTKIRIVMNASSKSQTGLSLNDVAMIGPVVQPDIVTILLRFREHRHAFSCDIQKMYPQVLIHSPHKDYHRIIWRFDSSQPFKHYRSTGVCFGVSSSPYLATRVLLDLAGQGEVHYPLASAALKNNFYVDDCLISFPTLDQALECQQQLVDLLKSAGMSLSKWCANNSKIVHTVKNEESQDLLPDVSKALGMYWHPETDLFSYKLTKNFANICSKRGVLSAIASLYDPLGLIGPVIIFGKLLLQEAWGAEIGWDEPLPTDILNRWNRYGEDLLGISELHVSRWVSSCDFPIAREIHIFCDSSSYAYGAVAYVVTLDRSQERFAKLVMAKSRIAPVQQITIPKLELCAALLGAHLLRKIKDAMTFTDYYIWTDSTIVLGQIRSKRTKLDVFTSPRITEILKLTDVARWQHVPGDSNPADIISRGMSPAELKGSKLWWNGPVFLTESSDKWPQDPLIVAIDAPTISQPLPETHPIEQILTRSNNYTRIRHILAYIMRFLTNPQARSKGPLTHIEIQRAERKLVAFVQDQHLSEEKMAISDGSIYRSKRFASIRQLTPFLDEYGIIRVGGRLSKSAEMYDVRHPMLLPKCHLATIVAIHVHNKNMHAGPQLLLAALRQTFWPLGGRNLTRRIVRACVVCCKTRPRTETQMLGDLPAERIIHLTPFSSCGVDFCGPLLTRPSYRRGGVSYKTYVCAFVCFTTKAVHLEVVGSLTTEGFIAALRRFVARRSAPKHIYCDNATNFRGASTELTDLFKTLPSDPSILQETAEKGISWHFAPPRSPHHGGLYEAVIKSLKFHLTREIGQTILTFEELTTILTQVEAILNSRPLTPLSEDPNEMSVLTPGHFLVGRPLNALPEKSLTDVSPSSISRWQLCQKLLQHFAERWRVEYLHTLQKRSKWSQESPNLQVGDLVLICDDASLSTSWPMGIIEELHPGRDGRCRVVTVRTNKGSYTRAVQKIARLPIEGLPPSE